MYESYWGLSVRPFDDRTDPAFYYPAEGHQAALVRMRYIFERPSSAAVVAGPSGTGKTLLLEAIERQLSARQFVFARVAFPLLSRIELLSYLADQIGETGQESSGVRPVDVSLRQIERGLERFSSQEKRVIIVVDDAHSIDDPQALEALRLLMNLDTPKIPGPSLLLTGQTRLLQTLERTSNLDDRISAKCLLRAFSVEETAGYLAHRIQAAGRVSDVFDASAVEAIHARAGGIPRRINRLGDLALLVGFVNARQSISAPQIEAIADELSCSTISGRECAVTDSDAMADAC
jgi:general secretion pathway protein A